MPGTISQAGQSAHSLYLMSYNQSQLTEEQAVEAEVCRQYIDDSDVTWIHVQGTPDRQILRVLAKIFNIHDLYLEDILNTGHRPKAELSEDQAFAILSLPALVEGRVLTEQVCLFLTDHTVISFCSGTTDPFELVRSRVRNPSSKMRKRGADYLVYTLIDSVIDHGFPVIEGLSEQLQRIENTLLDNPDNSILQDIYYLLRQLLLLKRRLWPQRDLVSQLQRDKTCTLIDDETRMYLGDCHDHTVNIIELLETYYEISHGMLDIYLSGASHRLNEVMRVLTVISVLFIPPTFLVGVYGMNFDPAAGVLNMPELDWSLGYVGVWLVIVAMMGGMLMYFRRKKWL